MASPMTRSAQIRTRFVEMLRTATKAEPRMWGSSIVGFDTYHYVGKSGREGDWLLAGMSPANKC